MCLEHYPPLPGPETRTHCCPTFRKVPPKAVSVEPSERCGEPTIKEQLVFDNSWTLTLSVDTSLEAAMVCWSHNSYEPGQICTYTAQTWRWIIKPGRCLETLNTADSSVLPGKSALQRVSSQWINEARAGSKVTSTQVSASFPEYKCLPSKN